MCIRDSPYAARIVETMLIAFIDDIFSAFVAKYRRGHGHSCLLYTSDAADERSSVDLGGRRIIKKKNNTHVPRQRHTHHTIIEKDTLQLTT